MKKVYRRDYRGRFDRDTRLYQVFIAVVSVIAVSWIGVNTIWDWAKGLERTFVVENSRAEETIHMPSWQDEVKIMIRNAGLSEQRATRLIFCESSWNPDAVNFNVGSIDRGLWQINSLHHSEVSKDCAYDPICSTIQAIRIIKSKGWSEWSCISKGLIK